MCSETERVRWDRCVVKQKGCVRGDRCVKQKGSGWDRCVVKQKGSGGIGV